MSDGKERASNWCLEQGTGAENQNSGDYDRWNVGVDDCSDCGNCGD